MTAVRHLSFVSAGALLAAALVLPATTGIAAQRAPLLSYDFTGFGASAPAAPEAAPAIEPVAEKLDTASVNCIAKVVHHEARNQPRTGQIAVAQTLINRLKAGRFGSTICQVANQRGQYFDTAAYRPQKDETWDQAIDVARDALSGEDEVVPGAIFFRAAYVAPTSFFRTRQRIASIGDHVFYR